MLSFLTPFRKWNTINPRHPVPILKEISMNVKMISAAIAATVIALFAPEVSAQAFYGQGYAQAPGKEMGCHTNVANAAYMARRGIPLCQESYAGNPHYGNPGVVQATGYGYYGQQSAPAYQPRGVMDLEVAKAELSRLEKSNPCSVGSQVIVTGAGAVVGAVLGKAIQGHRTGAAIGAIGGGAVGYSGVSEECSKWETRRDFLIAHISTARAQHANDNKCKTTMEAENGVVVKDKEACKAERGWVPNHPAPQRHKDESALNTLVQQHSN